MSALAGRRPTPKQAALLAAVRDDLVTYSLGARGAVDYFVAVASRTAVRDERFTARDVERVWDRGWIEAGDTSQPHRVVRMRLTDAGRLALDVAGRTS